MRLYYDERGLDRYYGLLELVNWVVLENVAGRYEIDGKKVYAKPSTKIQNNTSPLK